ncbi:SDR family oxidoreductase [Micromonospora purpureochromogenes]|uniref:SDR family oxidoreductase n=1 Tax=Micromonospora purpureochromogenes TaxID=47872 RepID=UPI00332A35E6
MSQAGATSTRFTGRTAIVTGASRGIGLAIAERLVAEGAKVVITARRQEALDQAVAQLGSEHALGVAGHADDADHQAEVVARAVDTFGSVDLLVNNTGINPTYGPMVDMDLAVARKIFEVNCLAALAWVQQAYRRWMKEHGGAVVNVSSVAGLRPAPGIGFYGASKAMLTHLTQQLAVELGPDIRVNAVAPAVVKTKFATALYEGREERVAAAYPLKRLGVPDDIGSVVAFLLSEDAAWMTGQLLVIDGGVTLTGGV